MISFVNAMRQMRQMDKKGKAPIVSLDVVKLDEKRNTGGEIKHLEKVCINKLRKETTGTRHKRMLAAHTGNAGNYPTLINMYDYDTKQIIKIHPRLIVKLNGEIVYY